MLSFFCFSFGCGIKPIVAIRLRKERQGRILEVNSIKALEGKSIVAMPIGIEHAQWQFCNSLYKFHTDCEYCNGSKEDRIDPY